MTTVKAAFLLASMLVEWDEIWLSFFSSQMLQIFSKFIYLFNGKSGAELMRLGYIGKNQTRTPAWFVFTRKH